MTFEEREIHIEELRLRREENRQKIAELSAERRRYVAEQIEARGLDDSRAFDAVVRRAIRARLEERGFELGSE